MRFVMQLNIFQNSMIYFDQVPKMNKSTKDIAEKRPRMSCEVVAQITRQVEQNNFLNSADFNRMQ